MEFSPMAWQKWVAAAFCKFFAMEPARIAELLRNTSRNVVKNSERHEGDHFVIALAKKCRGSRGGCCCLSDVDGKIREILTTEARRAVLQPESTDWTSLQKAIDLVLADFGVSSIWIDVEDRKTFSSHTLWWRRALREWLNWSDAFIEEEMEKCRDEFEESPHWFLHDTDLEWFARIVIQHCFNEGLIRGEEFDSQVLRIEKCFHEENVNPLPNEYEGWSRVGRKIQRILQGLERENG